MNPARIVMPARALCLALVGVLAGVPPAGAAPVDPLQLPAAASRLAVHSPLFAIARAGTRLVAVGQRGHILTSDNNGVHWLQAEVPVSTDLVAVHFPSAQQGWAVGHDGVILHSADGGRSWVKQLDGRAAAQAIVASEARRTGAANAEAAAILAEAKRMLAEGPDQPFLDVWFTDDKQGYAVGAFNLIFMTQDGGKTWLPISERVDNPQSYHLYSLYAAGGNLYIAGELGLLLRLDRTSGRFVALPTPYKGTWFGVLAHGDWLLAFGLRGNAWRSSDGGRSWLKIATSVSTGLTSGTIADDGRIVLVSQGGQILLSSDRGQTFERLATGAPTPIYGVGTTPRQGLVLVGARGVRLQAMH